MDDGSPQLTVVDKATEVPLPGANVAITARWSEGEEIPLPQMRGTVTDLDGDYFIINVEPGYYSVRVSMVGYNTEVRTQVRVQIDKTTRLDFALSEQVLESEGVTVTAFREDRIEIDQTATKQAYTMAAMDAVGGINDIEDILDLQADVVDGHFRGGRSGEALYLVGGASIIDPLSNESSFTPMTV